MTNELDAVLVCSLTSLLNAFILTECTALLDSFLYPINTYLPHNRGMESFT